MAAEFPPAPTHTNPIEVVRSPLTGEPESRFSPIWLKWFLDVASFISASGGASGSATHNALSGMQGGGGTEFYHLTATQHGALTAGFSGTGSIARVVGPSFSTPNLGVASGTSLAVTGKLTGGAAGSPVASSVSLSNGSGAGAGTLTNAPSAGDPTKWVPIDDNGTTRYFPTWT